MEYEVFVVDDDALGGKGWVIVRGADRSSLLLTRSLVASEAAMAETWGVVWRAAATFRPLVAA